MLERSPEEGGPAEKSGTPDNKVEELKRQMMEDVNALKKAKPEILAKKATKRKKEADRITRDVDEKIEEGQKEKKK